jgi:hypothetical protein
MLKFFSNIFRRDPVTEPGNCKYRKQYKPSSTDKMNLNNLSPMARSVTQNHGTEPPFSSPLNNNKQHGLYNCVVCNTPVFRFI